MLLGRVSVVPSGDRVGHADGGLSGRSDRRSCHRPDGLPGASNRALLYWCSRGAVRAALCARRRALRACGEWRGCKSDGDNSGNGTSRSCHDLIHGLILSGAVSQSHQPLARRPLAHWADLQLHALQNVPQRGAATGRDALKLPRRINPPHA